MTTLTLKINDNTKKGQAFLEFLNQFIKGNDNSIEILKIPNSETIKIIEDVEKGKGLIKTKNHADLLNKLNG